MVTKSRNGEFIGLAMSASFLKEKIDLAHCRGYAVLVIRVTSADDPDDKAVYNMYQIDANKGRAVSNMYEALRKVRANIGHIIMTKADAILTDEIDKALAKAEGRNA